jgi:hypothetical protein
MDAMTEPRTPGRAGPAIELRGPHRRRPIRFAGVHQLDDWRVKLYEIATPGRTARPELVRAAVRRAREALPRPARAADRYGVGFVIVHDAADFGFVLVDWWYGENEIHQKLFSAEPSRPGDLRPHPGDAIGCIWELSVTDFERRAWIEDVLTNDAGPDLEVYLSRQFNADV